MGEDRQVSSYYTTGSTSTSDCSIQRLRTATFMILYVNLVGLRVLLSMRL